MAQPASKLSFQAKKIEANQVTHQRLQQQLKKYQLVTLPIEKISQELLKNKEKEIDIFLSNTYNFRLHIFPKQLFSTDYQLKTVGKQGIVKTTKPNIQNYEGYHNNQIDQSVKLTVAKDFLCGMIVDKQTEIFIEPLQHFFPKTAKANQYLIYTATDVIPSPTANCVAIARHQHSSKPPIKNKKVAEDCLEVEVASAYDFSMFQKYGSVEATINRGTSIMNLIAANFINAFTVDINFLIVENLVITTTDPWTDSVDGKELLSNFLNWGESGGFDNAYDMAQLWTNRDFNSGSPNFDESTVGLAYVEAFCGVFRYQLLEDFTTNLQSMRVMVAHETGHNFGATHDASDSPDIMAPTVNPSATTWSTASTTAINNHLNAVNCLDACGCTINLIASTSQNCNPTTATYDLSLTVDYKSVGDNGFTVTIDGIDYPQSYTTAPQTILITNLPTQTTPANIKISDNTIQDCTISSIYQTPHPLCTCTSIQQEDFNTCALPNNWTTEGIGTNPQATWQFGIPTGNSEEGGSFDGTCLAYFDDDAYDGFGIEGDGGEIVTLTSPPIDVTNFENITLGFDYNFRQWDNSYFQVAVWTGNNWQTIFQTDENDCGNWNCNFPRADLPISNYINEQFQVKFTFHDDDTWAWYVGIDNFEICGFPITSTCDATFEYFSSEYTIDVDNDPTPIILGDENGLFTVTPDGLVFDSQTGTIDLANSLPNDYLVTYTAPNECTFSFPITIIGFGVEVAIKVWLEGATTTDGDKMSNQLRLANLIPPAQPYHQAPWNHESTAFFDNILTILPTAVDWVLVELRNADNIAQVVDRKVGLLLTDGSIVDWKTNENLVFETVEQNKAYYLVVRHRNHLDILSNTPIILNKTAISYDFTIQENRTFGVNQTKLLPNGKWAMLAGDVNGDGSIVIGDLNTLYLDAANLDNYTLTDINLDKAVTITDLNIFKSNSGVIGVEEIRY